MSTNNFYVIAYLKGNDKMGNDEIVEKVWESAESIMHLPLLKDKSIFNNPSNAVVKGCDDPLRIISFAKKINNKAICEFDLALSKLIFEDKKDFRELILEEANLDSVNLWEFVRSVRKLSNHYIPGYDDTLLLTEDYKSYVDENNMSNIMNYTSDYCIVPIYYYDN